MSGGCFGERGGGGVSALNMEQGVWGPTDHLHSRAVTSLHVHVKVQHQQLGLLGAVAAAHGAHQLGVGRADAPHHAAAAAALQRHQVADELARLQVPQLHRAVVRAGDDKVLVELQAGHGALVLVGTCGGRRETQGWSRSTCAFCSLI